jgi:hypothetical protein
MIMLAVLDGVCHILEVIGISQTVEAVVASLKFPINGAVTVVVLQQSVVVLLVVV